MPQTRLPLYRLLFWGTVLVVLICAAVVVWPRFRLMRDIAEVRSALARGDMDAALHGVERAVTVGPNSAEAHYLLAVVARRAGRMDEFPGPLRRAAELGWSEGDVMRQQWLAAAQQGSVEDVRRQLLQIVESGCSDEEAEEVYEAFTKGYLRTYRLPDAWLSVSYWLEWRPDAVQARIMRARIYEQQGKREEGMDDYRAVLRVFPNHREARVRLAQSLVVRERNDEALAEFQVCLAMAPEDPDALLGAAQCLRRMGDTAESRRYLEAAILVAATPYQRGMALAELGHALLLEGKPREALEPLRQALVLVPGESVVYHGLGMALARTGNRQQADYYHARLRHVRDEFARMRDIVDRLGKAPFDADLRCEAGGILMEVGLKKEGADWLFTALKCNPKHPKTHELLGQYYAELGQRSQAGHHRLLAAENLQPAFSAKSK